MDRGAKTTRKTEVRMKMYWMAIGLCMLIYADSAPANSTPRPQRGLPSGFASSHASNSLSGGRSSKSASYGGRDRHARGNRNVHHASHVRHGRRNGAMAAESVYLGRRASDFRVRLQQPAGQRNPVRYAHAGRAVATSVQIRRSTAQVASPRSTDTVYKAIIPGVTAAAHDADASSIRAVHARPPRSLADNRYQNPEGDHIAKTVAWSGQADAGHQVMLPSGLQFRMRSTNLHGMRFD